jgi:hypothetical protein
MKCMRSSRRVSMSVFLLFLLAICSLPGMAQTAVTSLSGTVYDPQGAVIAHAAVTISHPETGFSKTTKTDALGLYSFEQLPPGQYTISTVADGFGRATQTAELLVNQPVKMNFKMGVSAMTTVQVSTAAPVLNTTDATIGTPFDTSQIQSLPFEGNNVLDLLSLQAGVLFLGDQSQAQVDTDSRSGAVNGARSDQSNVTLDGVDDNTQTLGLPFQGALRSTRDSVEEFRVVTTNSNADSGRSSGAQIALVTRSGTNHWHGSAYEYFRPTNTVANNWFNKQAQLESGEANRPPKLLRNTFGGSLGGPLKKDKFFFFGAYEAQKLAESSTVTNEVPTASFLAGNLTYLNAAGNTTTLGSSDLARIDPNCSASGSCPLGPGANPAVLSYLSQYPAANGNSQGDGYNLASYTFASPSPASLVTNIVRLDYNLSARQQIWVRGNLQQDNILSPQQFPGGAPTSQTFDNTRGIAAGDTLTISDRLVNSVRYAFVRQAYANKGDLGGQFVYFNSITPLNPTTTTLVANIPVNNVVDDLTWSKGRHTLQFGANYRGIFDNHSNNTTLYNNAEVTYGNLIIGSIAGTGTSLDPGAFGYPAVDGNFSGAYNIAAADITGLITLATGYDNYSVSNGALTALPQGVSPTRHFFSNELEYYVQDSWKVKPNLTLNFGLRHSLLQVPYERDGQQVVPTFSLSKWFANRVEAAATGNVVQPPIAYTQGGQAAGKPAYWSMDKFDIAPRFSFAYSPNSTLSVRGGFGIYYDHFGDALVDAVDERGSFGLSSQNQNGATQQVDTTPRFSTSTYVPPQLIPPSGNSGAFPVTAPNALATTWALNDNLKTPYSEVIDFSIQQEIGHGTVFELDYTGRLGRRLMQQVDLAEPLDLVDPKSGIDLYTAGTQLEKYIDKGIPANQVPTSPYWDDLFPLAGANGLTPTQNIYLTQWAPFRGNETAGLFNLDLGYAPGAPNGETYRYFNPQFVNLVGWTSIGTSSYHGLQASLHHPMSHGVQLDFNYTFAKSLDLGSDAERLPSFNSRGLSQIINSFSPKLNKAPSDFDVRHAIAANGSAQLPFGQGKRFGSGVNHFGDALINNWTLNSVAHWTSGLPWGAIDGLGWSTNFDSLSWVTATGPIKNGGHKRDSGGQPNAFGSPTAALANIRLPYTGETGERNYFRGDGYFSIDAGLDKVVNTFRGQQLKFSWETFNVSNSVRFDPNSISNNPYGGASFGRYSALLTQSRRMQFALRYSF